jgi:hypothetical protein
VASRLPPAFPRYRSIRDVNEVSAFLANASYVLSLGGPPLANLKYGVFIVPVGEESFLLGPKPEKATSRDFLDAVEDARRAYNRGEDEAMHDPDRDSDEFLRHRFADDEFPVLSTAELEAQEEIELPTPALETKTSRRAKRASPPPESSLRASKRRKANRASSDVALGDALDPDMVASANQEMLPSKGMGPESKPVIEAGKRSTRQLAQGAKTVPRTSRAQTRRGNKMGGDVGADASKPQGVAQTRKSPRKRRPD